MRCPDCEKTIPARASACSCGWKPEPTPGSSGYEKMKEKLFCKAKLDCAREAKVSILINKETPQEKRVNACHECSREHHLIWLRGGPRTEGLAA